MPGEHRHPHAGVSGSKPRERIRKLPAAEIEEQSRIYLAERNKAMRLRRHREEMRLALERNQLIERELVHKQLAFLMIEMRQKLLALPQRVGARFKSRDVTLAREIADYAGEVVHETLNTLARLPECSEPEFVERWNEFEEGSS
jgi:hypothetical protein